MKTPIFDNKIEELKHLESLEELSEFGEKMLTEFNEIKQVLNLAGVVKSVAAVCEQKCDCCGRMLKPTYYCNICDNDE